MKVKRCRKFSRAFVSVGVTAFRLRDALASFALQGPFFLVAFPRSIWPSVAALSKVNPDERR